MAGKYKAGDFLENYVSLPAVAGMEQIGSALDGY